jgi:hypothetical protein
MERFGQRITREDILGASENVKKFISFSGDLKTTTLEILVLLARNVNPEFVLPKGNDGTLGDQIVEPLCEVLPYNRIYLIGFLLANHENHANDATLGELDGRELSAWILEAQKMGEPWIQRERDTRPQFEMSDLTATECKIIQAHYVEKKSMAATGLELGVSTDVMRQAIEKWENTVKH